MSGEPGHEHHPGEVGQEERDRIERILDLSTKGELTEDEDAELALLEAEQVEAERARTGPDAGS